MPGYSAPRVLSFEAHDLPIDLPQIEAFRGRGGRDRELTIPELVRTGGDLREPEEFRGASIANFNHRMVQVAAMFALPLLALSLAIPPKRISEERRVGKECVRTCRSRGWRYTEKKHERRIARK